MLDQQMKPANAGSRTALRASTVLTAAGIVLAGGPAAGQVQEEPRWKRPSDYSSAKDWNLKAENIVPHGLNWFALDKTTNSVYAFGEVSWEINEEGKPVFGGTWRAGEPDGENSLADPGLLMPGTFTIGGRYIFDGSRSIAYGGSENIEAGIEITVPAGTFKNCVRVREQGLLNLKDITDKTWCPVVGVVYDTSDGKLIVSNALSKDNPASDVSSIGAMRDKPLKYTPPVAKISGNEATKIALERSPGVVTKLEIERKRGKNVYVVEIRTPQGEKDVFVDIESGDIVGTDP